MIKHIVMWKLRDDAENASKGDNALKMKYLLERLKTKIKEIVNIEVGINTSDSRDSYDVVMYSEFRTPEDLQNYQNHPEELKVADFVKKICLEERVIDYEADDAIPMHELPKLEYEQASQDWRHRDSLTWQIPAVLVIIGGVLIAEAFKLPPDISIWIKRILLFSTLGLGACLSIALTQNLYLQGKNREIIEYRNPRTKRFGFMKLGSYLLVGLSWSISALLGIILLDEFGVIKIF